MSSFHFLIAVAGTIALLATLASEPWRHWQAGETARIGSALSLVGETLIEGFRATPLYLLSTGVWEMLRPPK